MKHIAFDLGAESGRAIVGEIINGKLVMEELHRFSTQGTRVNSTFRWDIYRLFDEIKEGLKKYAAQYGDEECTIGVDTWGVDYGFLDRNGKLCSIPYHYRDQRSTGTQEIIDEKIGLEKLYELTGIQQMEINTLNQLIAANRDNDPVVSSGERLLFIGDILHYFLCGSTKAEYSIASTSNMYSTITDEWSDEVLDTFAISRDKMPVVVPAGTVLGTTREDVADEVGMSKECRIITPPVHDTASAATALPSLLSDVAFISSGTWSMVGLELDDAVVNEQARKNNIANYGSSFNKKIFVKNVMGLWLIQQSRKQWLKSNTDLSYSDIVELAQQSEPFYGFVDPNDVAFLNPNDMPREVCAYLKKTSQRVPNCNDIGQVARIIFESLALKYRAMFDLLTQAADKTPKQINIIGGGIQNKMLTQFTANATGLKVIAGPIEATATGNILMQAYGSGEIASLKELRQTVIDTFVPTVYLPEDMEAWQEAYQRFVSMCE